MKKPKQIKTTGGVAAAPFSFDAHKSTGSGNAVIFGASSAGKSSLTANLYAELGLSAAEFELVRKGNLK